MTEDTHEVHNPAEKSKDEPFGQRRVCLIHNSIGIYIPQHFAKYFAHDWNVPIDDINELLRGPESGENYWQVWDEVLDKAWRDSSDGKLYLFQYGDLFAVKGDEDAEE
jgi:hypothetical protein